jgi:hypothetical protein
MPAVMKGSSVAALIDSLLAAEKSLEGFPDWQAVGNGDEERLVLPVFVGSKSTDASVEIDAYPNAPVLRFRILLNVEKCVWRIDYTDFEPHVNPVDTFSTISPYSFTEPHFHSWSDNRRYCTQNSLPSKLKIARPIPPNLRSFDAVFRWFCGEVNIDQPASNMVYLPRRTRLI